MEPPWKRSEFFRRVQAQKTPEALQGFAKAAYPEHGCNSVSVLIIAATGNLLALQRSGFLDQPGSWGLPGGAIDIHETPIQAAIRETLEETGYRLERVIPIDRRQNGGFGIEKFHMAFAAITETEFVPRIDLDPEQEHDDYQWVTLDTWPTPAHKKSRHTLEKKRKDIEELITQAMTRSMALEP